ncbi:MAG TPA: hypothetical protein VK179_09730 [Bacteroidales bacterium]|nr:hypothetical protein [Bacteroidales bacterium]
MNLLRNSIIIIGIFLELFSLEVGAQNSEVFGRLVDSLTHMGIASADIFNYNRNVLVHSDSLGYFKIGSSPGDTLVLSAGNNSFLKIVVAGNYINSKSPSIFSLSIQSHTLSEARIYGWNNYPEFREDFIDLELAETDVEKLNNSFSDRIKIEGRAAYDSALLSGKIWAPGPFPIYTRDEKERLKLKARVVTDSQKKKVYEKFNPGLIRKITGLTDEEEIIKFMVYCHFSDEYLLDIMDIDLYTEIEKKYREYSKASKQ